MVNWSGTLTSRATKLIRLNRAWGPEPGGASRLILIPLLTMIAIKFVFFFDEDQRLSPLPIRLSHRRWRWTRSSCRRRAEMICARVSTATLMRPSSVCLWEGGEGRADGALGGAARGGTLGMEEKHVV